MKYSSVFMIVAALMTVIASAVSVGSSPAVATAAGQPVELRWALGAVSREGDVPDAITRDASLEGGTRLKFLLEPISEGPVYLLLLDSDDEIEVLYRKGASAEPERAYIPDGNRWFQLDANRGRETFFILASSEPLQELDRLLATHESSDAAGRKEISGAVVSEVRRLQKANRRFASLVEKPVMIGGRTRGSLDPASSLDRLAIEISTDRFYSKTITIDH